jgi:hypothetical protein
MHARTATPARAADNVAEADSGNPRGRLLVGDHLGQMAADAAQAVRRAGLRPGLERSFGCQPDLLGRVVAQDPAADTELTRNAMVTLYVAAPGPAQVGEDPAGHPHPSCEPDMPPGVADAASGAERHVHRKTLPVRRRKPRPLGRPAWASDDPLASPRVQGEVAPVGRTELVDADPAADMPDEEEPHGELLDDGCRELPADELVVHADDVFAGRAGLSWRRVYPTHRGLASFGNQPQRRWSR